MGKLRELSKVPYSTRKKQIPTKSDAFYIIYNHRRIMRARLLKRLQQEKRKQEKNYMMAQKYAQKEENVRNWNFSMLQQDSVWQNAYDGMKKQEKQQDSNITRSSQFEQKMQQIRLQIIYNFAVTQKTTIFQNKFSSFQEQWLQYESQVLTN